MLSVFQRYSLILVAITAAILLINFIIEVYSFPELCVSPKTNIVKIERKFVHLDLKGAPPIVNYYRKFFPLLRKLGADGLLIEYENMFPYYGVLQQLPTHNAYTANEITEILRLARINDLEVVPLIQTFGHLEFILKLQGFEELREVPSSPEVICPSNNRTQYLLQQMIDQVVALHPHIKWLHIGSDEVYYIGKCDRCKEYMRNYSIGKNELFIRHVKSVAKYIKNTHKLQPIMWDDMFRTIPEEEIVKSEIWKHVEIMAWQYRPIVDDVWMKYGRHFQGVWVASAFKGATGINQYLTNISYHLENHISWINVLSKCNVALKGFVLTGWQRYHHFAVLCELLPVAIPSLAINLLFLEEQTVDDKLFQKARDVLMCDSKLTRYTYYDTEEVSCNFPGSNVLTGAQRLAHLNKSLHSPSRSPIKSATKAYNVPRKATLLLIFMKDAMLEVYDIYTVSEWIVTFFEPLRIQINKTYSNTE